MTLRDLFLVLKRYCVWLVVVPVICAALAGGFVAARELLGNGGDAASASLSVADPSNTLSSNGLTLLLDTVSKEVSAGVSSDEVEVTTALDSSAQSVTFAVVAPSFDEAQEIAETVVGEAREAMRQSLDSQAQIFIEQSQIPPLGELATEQNAASVKAAALKACVISSSVAEQVESSVAGKAIKYAAAGLAAGLFLAVLVLVLRDEAKKPIKTRTDVAGVTDLPVFGGDEGVGSADLACASLLEAASGCEAYEVCLLPIGAPCEDFGSQLKAAFEGRGMRNVRVVALKPTSEDASGVYQLLDTDAVIICVSRWQGSSPDLASCLEECKLVGAEVSGIVLN